MQESNKIFIELTANYHLVKICENFLTNKFGLYDEVDHYLIDSFAYGN